MVPIVSDSLDFEVRGPSPDGQVVIDLRGEVDVYNAPRLRNELARVVQEGGLDIVLDVEGLDFVDVTGLGVIIAAAKRIGDAGGHVTLRAPTRAVRRIVDLTQQQHFLTVSGRPPVTPAA
jgi:anti-sigma B factor antagonist